MLVFFETCFRNFGENNNTMVFKINISSKDGKTYKLETETEELIGKKINDIIPGETLLANLNDYELKITGASDKAGFPYIKDLEGSLGYLMMTTDSLCGSSNLFESWSTMR